MDRTGIRRLASFVFVTFSIQLMLGASALPCLSMNHVTAAGDAPQAGAMAGMSMPDAGTGEHGRDDCNQESSNATCEPGMTCAAAAIPSIAILLVSPHRVSVHPVSLPATLQSALTVPDRPPPRA